MSEQTTNNNNPTSPILFHLGLLHTILDERLVGFESYYETPPQHNILLSIALLVFPIWMIFVIFALIHNLVF